MTPPPPAWRAAWILVRLRLRRLVNMTGSTLRRRAIEPDGTKRRATPGKSTLGWIAGAFVAACLLASFLHQSVLILSNMKDVLGSAEQGAQVAEIVALHPLRVLDALRMGAALVWAAGHAAGHAFISLGARLREAAAREGFDVLTPA